MADEVYILAGVYITACCSLERSTIFHAAWQACTRFCAMASLRCVRTCRNRVGYGSKSTVERRLSLEEEEEEDRCCRVCPTLRRARLSGGC